MPSASFGSLVPFGSYIIILRHEKSIVSRCAFLSPLAHLLSHLVKQKQFNGRVIEDSWDVAELLLAEKQVSVVPGVAFEAEGYCRLSYAVSMDNILEGLDRIAAFVNELD